MAITNYEFTIGNVPPGGVGCDELGESMSVPKCPPGVTGEEKNEASGLVVLLPFLELGNLEDQLALDDGGLWNRDVDDLAWYQNDDKKAGVRSELSILWCPSENGDRISTVYQPLRAATSSCVLQWQFGAEF